MHSPIHFYLTFNPHKNDYVEPDYTQAHEFYDYLKEEIKKNDKSYAYWGKFIGADRESKIDIEQFREIINTNNEHNSSTHIYISDFKSLWVGKVESVHKNIKNDFKTLKFYKDKNVEIWFKISDFTLLEYCYESTANKISELFIDNKYMNLRIDELSPFTTGIKYPALVQDLSEEAYFDESEDHEGPLILKENQAINNTGLVQVTKTLQTYALPESLYSKIPHSAKNEIESAELDMLEHRHHNLKKVAFSYIKALEIIVNDLVIHHMKRSGLGDSFFVNIETMPPKLYLDDSNSAVIPISDFKKNYSINQLVYFVQRCMKSGRIDFARSYKGKKSFLKYFTSEFPKIMEENHIYKLRGVLAHSDSGVITDRDAIAIRNLVLGIGHKGLIHTLYQCFYPEELGPIAKVMEVHQDILDETKKEKEKRQNLLKVA